MLKLPDAVRWLAMGVVLGLVVGLAVGWRFYRAAPAPVETPASAVRQADGSQILERAPDSAPGPAPHLIPAGGREERRIRIIVKPRPVSGSPSVAGSAPSHESTPTSTGAACPPCGPFTCPPVAVDLSLVRMPDGTRRVIGSSQDGQVVGGLDMPIERDLLRRDLRWAAGPSYGAVDRSPGVWVTYARGPFTAGADAFRTPPRGPMPASFEVRAMLGVRW